MARHAPSLIYLQSLDWSWIWHPTVFLKTRLPQFLRAVPSTALDKSPATVVAPSILSNAHYWDRWRLAGIL